MLSAAERASRRAEALRRLEETKARFRKTHSTAESGGSNSAQGGPPQIGQTPQIGPAPSVRDAQQPQNEKKSGLFAKPYIEYDFSTMKDSRGGFMVDEQEAATAGPREDSHAKWLESLSAQRPPYDFDDPRAPRCFECDTPEIDFRLWRVFGTRVCPEHRRANPEKYSLLTKTECKQDYLLTDPELRDEELLPHLERPNPYATTYSNMMLYMRYQVEEFAFKKWNGPEGLDAEWERREKLKKVRKQAKFEAKLRDMRNKTRAEAITSAYSAAGRAARRHVHSWTNAIPQPDGRLLSECTECGMSREELAIGK